MRSADPGGRAGGCIGRAPAESDTRRYSGSVVVAPAVSTGAIFTRVHAMRIYIDQSFFLTSGPTFTGSAGRCIDPSGNAPLVAKPPHLTLRCAVNSEAA